jgi:predicted fused transcriptional regulator/phosphomethylpyrimidine kinase
MWFDDSMNEAYDKGFRPAIEDNGYRAVRIDREHYNDKIETIKLSQQFVVPVS